MKKTDSFVSHSSALAALFILGNGVIIFPVSGADKYTFLGYITAALSGFLLYFILIPVINRLYTAEVKKIKPLKKTLFLIVYLITALAALKIGADAFLSFTEFASALLLKDYPKVIAIIVFLLTVVFFVSRRAENFLKFCLLAIVVTLAIIIFFFLASLNSFDFDNIVILNLPTLKGFYSQLKNYLLNPMLSTIFVGIYEVCVFKKVRPKATFWGLFIGYTLLGMCILNSVLMFGTNLGAALQYPYASAVSTVTIGRLFTRLDGFSYFVYFVSSLSKVAVCLFLVWEMLKKANKILVFKE